MCFPGAKAAWHPPARKTRRTLLYVACVRLRLSMYILASRRFFPSGFFPPSQLVIINIPAHVLVTSGPDLFFFLLLLLLLFFFFSVGACQQDRAQDSRAQGPPHPVHLRADQDVMDLFLFVQVWWLLGGTCLAACLRCGYSLRVPKVPWSHSPRHYYKHWLCPHQCRSPETVIARIPTFTTWLRP